MSKPKGFDDYNKVMIVVRLEPRVWKLVKRLSEANDQSASATLRVLVAEGIKATGHAA